MGTVVLWVLRAALSASLQSVAPVSLSSLLDVADAAHTVWAHFLLLLPLLRGLTPVSSLGQAGLEGLNTLLRLEHDGQTQLAAKNKSILVPLGRLELRIETHCGVAEGETPLLLQSGPLSHSHRQHPSLKQQLKPGHTPVILSHLLSTNPLPSSNSSPSQQFQRMRVPTCTQRVRTRNLPKSSSSSEPCMYTRQSSCK